MFVFTIGFLAFMLLPQFVLPLIAMFSPEGAKTHRHMVETTVPVIRTLGPLGLLALVLWSVATSWGDSAIYFSPADVDFLFPGPFSRRDLLLYKLSQSIRGNIAAGTFFSIFTAPRAPLLAGAWFGTVLSVLFLNAITLTLTLVGESFRSRLIAVDESCSPPSWHRRPRDRRGAAWRWRRRFADCCRAISPVVGRVNCAGPVRGVSADHHCPRAERGRGLGERWRRDDRGTVRPVDQPGFQLPGGGTAGERAQCMRTCSVADNRAAAPSQTCPSASPAASHPAFAVAWRPRAKYLATVAAAGSPLAGAFDAGGNRRGDGPVLFMVAKQSGSHSQVLLPAVVIGGLAYQSLLASIQLPTGFRGDIDRIDWLKSLPLHPAAIVGGQVSGGALLLSAMQAILLIAVWIEQYVPCYCWRRLTIVLLSCADDQQRYESQTKSAHRIVPGERGSAHRRRPEATAKH